jgi:hypothetical protein
MKRICAQLAVSLLAVSVACSDYRTPTAPLRPGDLPPSLGISDGLHSLGNQGFFFLPPLVRNPEGNPEFGDSPFKANAAPHIEICLLNTTDAQQLAAASCDVGVPLVKTFSAADIKVADNQYHANWHTDESDLVPGKYYRVTVFVRTQMLGFADVQPVSSSKDLRNPKTGDVIMLVDGRTLPIKFRIEEEAVCQVQDDCVKKRIKVADGGTVTTPSGDAALILPANFVAGAQEVEFTIQRISESTQECHTGTGAEKVLAFKVRKCFEATSVPSIFDLGGFTARVTWVQCFSIGELPAEQEYLEDFLQIFKSDPPNRLRALQEVPEPEGFCTRRIGAGPAPGGGAFAALRWRLDGLARKAGALFLPTPAYAIDGGLGGLLGIGDGLSRFQYGVAASMTRRGSATRVVPVGSSVNVSVAVTGIAEHHDPFPELDEGGRLTEREIHPENPILEFTSPLRGVSVKFELLRDGMVVASATDESELEEGEGGDEAVARASFTPTVAGDYTVRATASAAGSPVSFAITAVATPIIDGVFAAGEWGDPFRTFDVNLPGGGTTPGELFIRNDATNIYFAVRFRRSIVDPGNSASFEFDNDNSGTLNNGDDGIILNPSVGFRDLVRSDTRPDKSECPGCSFVDTDFGGTNDGSAAFANDGTYTVYEFSHPLNSGDVRDFSRSAGQTLGLFVFIRMIRATEGPAEFPTDYGDTDFPDFPVLVRFVQYTIR